MTAARQALFWLWGVAALVAALYLFRGILLPFVVGMAVAYFFDPAVDRLELWRLPRGIAAALVLALFFAAGLMAMVLLVPLIQAQLVNFIESVPDYVAWFREKVLPHLQALYARLPVEGVEDLRGPAGTYAADVIAWMGRVARGLWSEGLALLNLLSLLFVTPIVAFYLLRDWDRIVARIDGWLPRAHAGVIREQLRLIDTTLAGFVRGVGLTCLALAAFYGVALTLIGLDYGLVVGIAAGLISFIPYFGALAGLVVATALAFFQFSEWLPIALVVATFVVGQAVEGNFLTPRLVGKRIGLHPVWVLFALFAGGALFGFVGVLLAVPVAAVIGVLGRFAVGRYLESPLYLDKGKAAGEGPGAGGPANP